MSSATGGAADLDDPSWDEAVARGAALLAGAQRIRVRGASPSVEISALDWGGPDGDPRGLAVLQHANGFCAATWAPVAQLLARDYRVVAFDTRGHGDSTSLAPGGQPDPYHWDTLSGDIEHAIDAVLDRTGRDRVDLAIGHSMGGAMLLRVASRIGERISSLLLCDPVVMPFLSPEQQAEREEGSGLAAASLKRRDQFPSFEGAYDHYRHRLPFAAFAPEALALYVREGIVETAQGELNLKCRREVEAAIFGGAGSSSDFVEFEKVTARVLIAHAQRGNFDADHYEEVARQIPDGRVVSRDLGHLFPLEEPERVLELASELLGD